MNWALLVVLAAYMAHSMIAHWRLGPEGENTETHLHTGMPFPVMPVMLFLFCQVMGTPALAETLLSMEALVIAILLFGLLLVRQARISGEGDEAADWRAATGYILGGLLQTALLGVSCYIAWKADVLGRSLFEPKWVILGLIGGHAIFGVSLCFSHRSLDALKSIARYLVTWRPIARFTGESPRQVFACIDVSLMEEIIYRVALQGALIALTGNAAVAIVAAALIFSVVHRHFFYNHIVDSIEFLAFSLLLGLLFHLTGSLMLAVMIHTVRNLEIVYFDVAGGPLEKHDVPAVGVKAQS